MAWLQAQPASKVQYLNNLVLYNEEEEERGELVGGKEEEEEERSLWESLRVVRERWEEWMVCDGCCVFWKLNKRVAKLGVKLKEDNFSSLSAQFQQFYWIRKEMK